MARASTATMLSLDRFAKILGIHPLHFNQVSLGDDDGIGCENALTQHAWQAADGIGREDIAVAIAQAEQTISNYLHFKPKATWEVDERHIGSRTGSPVMANWGYAISGGIRAKTLLGDDEPLTYTDSDGDGYKETVTVSVIVGSVSADEIALYYPGKGADDAWEIRPISVSMSGSVATVTCRREQLVKEEFLESYNPRAVEGTTDSNFLTTVDMYRVWHDPSQHVQMLWAGSGCQCSGIDTCQACVLTGQYGCSVIRNSRSSIFNIEPGLWDADSETFLQACLAVARPPDRLRLWYRAGWRNMALGRPNTEMDAAWERAIAFYAASLLDRPLCSCKNTTNITNYWSEDLAKNAATGGEAFSYKVAKDVLGNPLGTTRGAIQAWRACQTERVGEAVCAM